ncbi:MAG: hypothetical protein HYU84_18325 [Chloroflexi bacterium]|nr:hypothetical protein [Chloroflexota bacterium]
MANKKQAQQKPRTWQWWVEKVFMPLLLALLSGYFLYLTTREPKEPTGDEATDTATDLQFTDCVVELECPDVDRIWDLYPEDTEWAAIRVFEASISADKPLRFSMGWCTKEESLLQSNLDQIELVFTINGVSYADKMKHQYDSNPDENDETRDDYCYLGGTVVSNWQKGVKYHIELGYLIKADINDGWDDYFRDEKRYSNLLLVIK